jgi:hypothetical protein
VVLALTVLGSLAFGNLKIVSTASCPSGSEVEQALEALQLPELAGSNDEVVVSSADDALVVVLFDRNHTRLAERRLAHVEDCRETARGVAIVVASWETVFPSQADGSLVAAPPVAEVQRSAEVKAEPSSVHLELGAGVLVSVASDGAAPAATAFGMMTGAGGHWGGALTLGVEGSRNLVLSPGSASWQRLTLSLGGLYRFLWRWGALDLQADAVAALLLAHGDGLKGDANASTFDPGVRLGGRLLVPVDRAGIWVGVWGLLFPRVIELVIAGQNHGPLAPRFEVLAGGGASLNVF